MFASLELGRGERQKEKEWVGEKDWWALKSFCILSSCYPAKHFKQALVWCLKRKINRGRRGGISKKERERGREREKRGAEREREKGSREKEKEREKRGAEREREKDKKRMRINCEKK